MEIKSNFNLKNLNTFNVNVFCHSYITINSREDLYQLYSENKFNDKHLILGGGSNVLFTKDYDGTVISLNLKGIDRLEDNLIEYNGLENNGTDKSIVLIKVYAGENWHNFVEYCLINDYYGLENLALIPGNIGAAPIQNIGAYGVEQNEFVYEIEAYNKQTNKIEIIDNVSCKFGYRDSIFKQLKSQNIDKYIIISVTYKLNLIDSPNLSYSELNNYLMNNNLGINAKNLFDCICKIRSSKLPDPMKIGNAGSFFKNPIVDEVLANQILEIDPINKKYLNETKNGVNYYKLSAARLIEFAGLKGLRIGETGVSDKHSLVMVNYGNASGEEINNLSNYVINKVNEVFGVILEKEVNII